MEKVLVELTTCPHCKATCVVGSDEDYQEFCASCKTSFGIKKIEEVTEEEFKRRKDSAKERYFAGPWEAFRP